MSKAYHMAMPVIIYCLGGEMVYILCSRLKAQEIPEDKSIKVIHDVVLSLFEPKVVAELTKHKNPAKHQEVRQMFEKLAHSSIMRLNPTSMSKLFELMLMALKLQILRTKYAEEIYKITTNHLESILKILNNQDPKGNKQIIDYVTEAHDKFNFSYKQLTSYDFVILKTTLLRFLQGKNVKVSIFIQESLQSNSSMIYLPMTEITPPYTKKPGIVEKYDKNGKVIYDDFIELKLSSYYIHNNNTDRINNFQSEFGLNMFSSEKPKIVGKIVPKNTIEVKAIEKEKPKEQTKKPIESYPRSPSPDIEKQRMKESTFLPTDTDQYYTPQLTEEQKRHISQNSKKEIQELSDLLSIPASNDAGTFKLDLFHNNHNKDLSDETEDYIYIEREDNNLKKKYDACFEIDQGNTNDNNDEDDLLDLMDQATK